MVSMMVFWHSRKKRYLGRRLSCWPAGCPCRIVTSGIEDWGEETSDRKNRKKKADRKDETKQGRQRRRRWNDDEYGWGTLTLGTFATHDHQLQNYRTQPRINRKQNCNIMVGCVVIFSVPRISQRSAHAKTARIVFLVLQTLTQVERTEVYMFDKLLAGEEPIA